MMNHFPVKALAMGVCLVSAGIAKAETAATDFRGFYVGLSGVLGNADYETSTAGRGTWDHTVENWNETTPSGSVDVGGNWSVSDQAVFLSSDNEFSAAGEIGYNFELEDTFLIGVAVGTRFGEYESKVFDGFDVEALTSTADADSWSDDSGSNSSGGTDGEDDNGQRYSVNVALKAHENGGPYQGNPETDRLTIDNNWYLSVKPMLVISESSALFLRASYLDGDLRGTALRGDASMDGFGFGVGFEINLGQEKDWFIGLELGVNEYEDSLSVSNPLVVESELSSTSTGEDDPTLDPADFDTTGSVTTDFDSTETYGQLTIGFRF